MPSILLAVTAALALSTSALADVSCKPYVPQGRTSDKSKINFFNNNPDPSANPGNGPGFPASTLPANATIARTAWPAAFILSNHSSSTGTAFELQACDIPSLGLTTNTTQSSCSHGGCYHTYTNYVRVRNPATAHCLTIRNYNASASDLVFAPCVAAPNDTAQVFDATQQVLYSPNYAKVTSYGFVELDVHQTFTGNQFFAWSLDRKDNKTVEVVMADYTQVGLSANLLEA